jgi:tetratricopeptide (TPR) repeat protein
MHGYRDIEADDCYDMALAWLRNKNYARAEECLARAIELNANFIHASVVLSGLYARQGRFHDAIHVLKKALRHDPDFDRLHFLMARYALKNEDYVNARIFIDRAVAANPSELHLQFRELIAQRYRRAPR